MIVSINPANGKELARYELHDDAFVDNVHGRCQRAKGLAEGSGQEERKRPLKNMAKALRSGKRMRR